MFQSLLWKLPQLWLRFLTTTTHVLKGLKNIDLPNVIVQIAVRLIIV